MSFIIEKYSWLSDSKTHLEYYTSESTVITDSFKSTVFGLPKGIIRRELHLCRPAQNTENTLAINQSQTGGSHGMATLTLVSQQPTGTEKRICYQNGILSCRFCRLAPDQVAYVQTTPLSAALTLSQHVDHMLCTCKGLSLCKYLQERHSRESPPSQQGPALLVLATPRRHSPFRREHAPNHSASELAMTPGFAPSVGRMLWCPAGLCLLFVGCFLMPAALCVASFALAARAAFAAATFAGMAEAPALVLTLLTATAALLIVLEICERGPPEASGAVLGTCIALTFWPAPIETVIFAVAVLSAAFAFVLALAPREVYIFISSYGGSFLIWHGLQLIDTDVFDGKRSIPSFAFASPKNVDMWFSVLSFLVVGLLGCCVQLILVRGQMVSASRSHYIDIP